MLSKDQDILDFSSEHIKTEQVHLNEIEKILPKNKHSKLLFLLKILEFLTGFIPVILGKKFVYATIFAVESFVEQHYQKQIDSGGNVAYKFYKTAYTSTPNQTYIILQRYGSLI